MPTSQCGRQSSWLTNSAYHLVRLEEQGRRKRQAEGTGGLEVDDQLELHGLLHGEVHGLGALQDLVHVGGGTPVEVRKAWAIGQETSARPVRCSAWALVLMPSSPTQARITSLRAASAPAPRDPRDRMDC